MKLTKYGGRGCFANGRIPKDTLLRRIERPVGSSISRPFRKEVCCWCFQYQNERTLKHRLQDKIYFCSEECVAQFQADDPAGLLLRALLDIETLCGACAGEIPETEWPNEPQLLQDAVDHAWQEVDQWEQRVFAMKALKRKAHMPQVSPDEYAEIVYVARALHCLVQDGTPLSPNRPESAHTEAVVFDMLQSAESQKVAKYPYLAHSYGTVYKIIRAVRPAEWEAHVTPQRVRDIIGRNLTNAFGIWLPALSPDEDQEYFGFAVYPTGSFFNHLCAANIRKVRVGAAYEFYAARDIEEGEELCISYGPRSSDPVHERQAALKEWFFECACPRCQEEQK